MKGRWTSRQFVTGIVSIIVSASLISLLILRIDFERTIAVLSLARWQWLLAASFMTCLLPFSAALRWQGILRAYGKTCVPFSKSVRAVMMANVLNSFLPAKGGDIAKAVYLKKQAGLSVGFGTVVIERLVDLAILGLLGVTAQLAGSNFGWEAKGGWFILLFVFFLVAVLLLPLQNLPLPEKILAVYQNTKLLFKNWLMTPVAIIQTLTGSIITWFVGGGVVLALTHSFETNLSFSQIYSIYPTAVIAGLIPITVSGIGTRDSAFVILLSGHLPLEEATLIGIGYTVFVYWLLSLICFPVVSQEIFRYLKER